MRNVPERVSADGLESAWSEVWERDQTYAFGRTADRAAVYSIDTPPPTVSGDLHLGTVFGYVQVDAMARYRRMSGKDVFYPIGWDDNGLPTERRVENLYGVRANPALPYDPALTAEPDEANIRSRERREVSRQNFLELCARQTAVDERGFEDVFRRVGLSVDWSLQYATIDPERIRIAQLAFLGDLDRGEAYLSDAPTLWDVDFQTAVAQAEIEDKQTPGVYVRYEFTKPDGTGLEIETSRPELLPACVAVVVHPDDERYAALVGTTVRSPLFDVEVPVHAHPLAAPDKGTGAAMVCTFGDTTDVQWWRDFSLPLRSVIGRDGRLVAERPAWLPEAAEGAWGALAGQKAVAARTRIIELLQEAGLLTAEPKPTQHAVKFYEQGYRPLEIVTSQQWYIRNGARDERIKTMMLQGATDLAWFPDHMRVRLEHWINGLNSDWLISRQRYSGVPFPVWYAVDADGNPDWATLILPATDRLPVDPQTDVPEGYAADQRGKAGGFVGDADIMDTWATSSLTPQIVCGWQRDPELFERTFPMDLRPQGPEIIRTWTFSTMLRSLLAFGELPWAGVSINGWILDPDRKKMSKSKGNTMRPADLLEEFGADGLRYWSCHAGQGVDTAVDRGQMKVGRRLAIKLLNVAKFVLQMLPEGFEPGAGLDVTEPVDRAMIDQLHQVSLRAEADFERNDYRSALVRIETFFWHWCDDYVELVKSRAYGDTAGAGSAQAALAQGLSILQRLLAPFLPFVAEESWSWWQDGSVHRAPWPGARADAAGVALAETEGADDVFEFATEVLRRIRRAKTEKQLGMRTPVLTLTVTGTADQLAQFRAGSPDLIAAGSVADVVLVTGEPFAVDVVLGDPPPKAPKNPA